MVQETGDVRQETRDTVDIFGKKLWARHFFKNTAQLRNFFKFKKWRTSRWRELKKGARPSLVNSSYLLDRCA